MANSLQDARDRLGSIRLPQGIELELEEGGVKVTLLQPRLQFRHSFTSGNLIRRARQSSQALLRACQNKQRNIASLLDVTAGWGADALTLACQGQKVTLVEQNPLLFAIVDYARASMAVDPALAEIATRFEIHNRNAQSFLSGLATGAFDCIYLDPMFPARKSGAKPGKEMQILQHLTANTDIETCFEQALKTAAKRVVVKRPARAPRLGEDKPDLVYREKSVRFDIYLT